MVEEPEEEVDFADFEQNSFLNQIIKTVEREPDTKNAMETRDVFKKSQLPLLVTRPVLQRLMKQRPQMQQRG
jgi:hypothetical protein